MNLSQIDSILEKCRTARWVTGNLGDLPCEGWFLLEVNPLPSGDELHKVVQDIADGRQICVSDGKIRHLSSCSERHDETTISQNVQAVLPRLVDHTFRIAVHPGLGQCYQGQPLAIVLDPSINYEVYPDHPHLNTGGVVGFLGQRMYVPDTICYEENISGLGSEPFKRYPQTFALLSDWLLRHMIWTETRKVNNGNGNWIGPQAASLTLKQRAEAGFWNPFEVCRCGSGKMYSDCHMLSDVGYSALAKSMRKDVMKQCIAEKYQTRREQHQKFYFQIRQSS